MKSKEQEFLESLIPKHRLQHPRRAIIPSCPAEPVGYDPYRDSDQSWRIPKQNKS